MKKYIPNLITLLNIAAGFLAIAKIIEGQFITAAWLVIVAMVFDFFDGFAARILKAYSELGKQLDSLADVVSFGVVPGILMYSLIKNADGTMLWPALLFPALLPMTAALRLAIFNLDTEQKEYFKGLPTPAAALSVVSIVLANHYGSSALLESFMGSSPALCLFSATIAFLMVSKVRMINLKLTSLNFKVNFSRYILVIVSAGALVAFGFSGIALLIPIYLIISVSDNLFR